MWTTIRLPNRDEVIKFLQTLPLDLALGAKVIFQDVGHSEYLVIYFKGEDLT